MCNPSQHDAAPLLPPFARSSRPRDTESRHILGLRLWYFFYFAAQFTQLFLPLVLDKVMHISSSTIGVLMSMRRFTIFLVAPLFAMLCDLTLLHRHLLLVAHAAYYFCTLLLTRVRALWAISAVIIMREAFIAGCEPAINTAAFAKLASVHGPGDDSASRFGSLRLFGSFGWGLTSVIVPVLCERFFGSSLLPVLYAQVVLGIPVLLVIGLGLDLSPKLFREGRSLKRIPAASVEADRNNNNHIGSTVVDINGIDEKSSNTSSNVNRNQIPNYCAIPSNSIESSQESNIGNTDASHFPSQPATAPSSGNSAIASQSHGGRSDRDSEKTAILCILAAFEQGVILGATQTTLLIYFAEVGVPVTIIGLSVLVGCFSEGSMFCADSWIRRRYNNDKTFIQVGIFVNMLSLLSYVSVGHLPKVGWMRSALVLATEMIGGGSYALFVSSMLQMANRVAPAKWQTGGQGVVTSVLYGVGPAVGALLSGWAYQQYGVGIIYCSMALWDVGVIALLQMFM